MPEKRNSGAFDFPGLTAAWPDLSDWPMPAFSNWAFAEREDRLEARTVDGLQKIGRTMWGHAEQALDDHMNFVSDRLHQDFECAKSLSQCTAPEEAFATLQAFYARMASEYQEHFEKQSALFRESFSDNAAMVEEFNDTAMQGVGELRKAAEESASQAKPKPASRRKLAVVNKG